MGERCLRREAAGRVDRVALEAVELCKIHQPLQHLAGFLLSNNHKLNLPYIIPERS